MVSTPTTRLAFEMQGQNDNSGSWWDNLNDGAIQLADDAIAKEAAIATTGGTTALTVVSYAADESRCPIIRIATGQTLVSNVNITTARARIYFVTNESAAGSFTVKFGGDAVSANVTIPRGSGAYVRVRSDLGTTFASPLMVLATGAIDLTSIAGGTYLVGSNNLSDVTTPATARSNLGLAIGTNVQAYDADLTTWATLTPSANAQSLVTAANYAAMRILLGLVIGTNVQAWDAQLDSLSSASANGVSLITAADYDAMRTLLSLAYATSAEQVTGTEAAKTLSPLTQIRHKSAVKAYAHISSAGVLLSGSYNIASVTHDGTGSYTVNLSITMANTDYTIPAGPGQSGTTVVATPDSTTAIDIVTASSGNAVPADRAFWISVLGDMA